MTVITTLINTGSSKKIFSENKPVLQKKHIPKEGGDL